MPVLYIGSSGAYAGKNTLIAGIGLELAGSGLKLAYFKPVGAQIGERHGLAGDEDAFCISQVLGQSANPVLVTPVLVTQDFKRRAFGPGPLPDLLPKITLALERLSQGKDLVLTGGSGNFLYSGKYSGLEGPAVAKAIGAKVIIIDRFFNEVGYDYLLRAREIMGDDLLGCVLNDIPAYHLDELRRVVIPFLASRGIPTLGIVPHDNLLAGVRVGDLAERMGARLLSAPRQGERMVERFLIGTMQMDNFVSFLRRQERAAVIVGGDRADLQLAAIEGDCACLILTGNLYPDEFVLSRAEDMDVPLFVIRDDTYSAARRLDMLLARHKLRDPAKIRRAAQLTGEHVDLAVIRRGLGLG